jgi:hypothetical protein
MRDGGFDVSRNGIPGRCLKGLDEFEGFEGFEGFDRFEGLGGYKRQYSRVGC